MLSKIAPNAKTQSSGDPSQVHPFTCSMTFFFPEAPSFGCHKKSNNHVGSWDENGLAPAPRHFLET